MTASLQGAGRQKYILQYVSWFTVSSTFYSQVNHKFEERSVGEASLRQMFASSRAFIHAHQWVLVVLGLSPIPPPLIKTPNTSRYLLCLRLFFRKSFFVIQAAPLFMHIFIYIESILAPTLHPTHCCGKSESVYQSSPPSPAARACTSTSREIKDQMT